MPKFKIFSFFKIFFLIASFIGLKANLCQVEAKSTLPGYLRHPPCYNITACEEPKFIWFRVAKVGTRSILAILREHVDLSISGFNIPFEAKKSKKYFKFAFVRNPWDRVVSCYSNKVVAEKGTPYKECFGKDFDFFVDFIDKQDLTTSDIHIRLQSTIIPLNDVDFIGRFERFAEDLRSVLDTLGLYDAEIVHRNRSVHAHYSTYYTDRTRKIIAKKYKQDIETFGYVFEDKKDQNIAIK